MKKLYLKPFAEVKTLDVEALIASSPTLGYKPDEIADSAFGALSPFRRNSWNNGLNNN